ncbi:MAG TPA: L-threonylcarbamoyladenylate synthase [Candidatus Limnocylindrales bacterium]|nr:L-threonylcarbamoyladenylate synthase [Candidatus Limnocylindrales bacterium]
MIRQPPIRDCRYGLDLQILQEAVEILREGGIVVCPTDTGYLLGGDGLREEVIRKIFEIKGRSFNKPIHLVVSDKEMAQRLAVWNEKAEKLFRELLPGPLTLILKKKEIVPDLLVSGTGKIGLRMPGNNLVLQLVAAAGVPITATSANSSGKESPFTVEEVLQQLEEGLERVDLILDQGETLYRRSSTIVDISEETPKVLREGPISPQQIFTILGSSY